MTDHERYQQSYEHPHYRFASPEHYVVDCSDEDCDRHGHL